MSRDLTTIAAQEQELRTAMKHTALALQNAENRLNLLKADQANQLAQLEALRMEANAAFDATYAIPSGPPLTAPEGMGVSVFAEPPEDAAVTAAFDRATTPQDGFTNGAEF